MSTKSLVREQLCCIQGTEIRQVRLDQHMSGTVLQDKVKEEGRKQAKSGFVGLGFILSAV